MDEKLEPSSIKAASEKKEDKIFEIKELAENKKKKKNNNKKINIKIVIKDAIP